MAHTDPNAPVRFIPAADYVARHRGQQRHRPDRRPLNGGDWRLLVAGVACLVAAAILALLTG